MSDFIHTLNDAVDGAEEADLVGKLSRPVGRRGEDRPDDVVLLLHQLFAVEVLQGEEREESNPLSKW